MRIIPAHTGNTLKIVVAIGTIIMLYGNMKTALFVANGTFYDFL